MKILPSLLLVLLFSFGKLFAAEGPIPLAVSFDNVDKAASIGYHFTRPLSDREDIAVAVNPKEMGFPGWQVILLTKKLPHGHTSTLLFGVRTGPGPRDFKILSADIYYADSVEKLGADMAKAFQITHWDYVLRRTELQARKSAQESSQSE